MEATAAARGGSLPNRQEWRAVSDHHSVRNTSDEEMERSKLAQSDERTIYEHGREPADVDFCSITVDGGLDNDILQQRIHGLVRQREDLQHMEIELRAQVIARSEIIGMQNSFNAQIKEHEDTSAKLQEQLHEKEQTICELERRMEEKDRELHAIKLDNEAAWAKEDLLREQNKELASFRRERDHSEAERVQHIQKIRDLQEHIQEKERQILELQDQHRADQETIFLKDEQLKAWVARVQEMDALQSTTHHSLQAELRERTEQYNQLWLGCQRQFVEMERMHVHAIQQLQLELADARERSGSYSEESRISQTSSKDLPTFGQNNGNQLDVNGGGASNSNKGALSNGNDLASAANPSSQVAGVPIAPSSLLGMATYLPPGQMAALHPYILHQQGIPHSMSSHVAQSHVGQFPHMQEATTLQQWQNEQAVSEGAELSSQGNLASSQADHKLDRSEANYDYELSANGQAYHSEYRDGHINQLADPNAVISSSTGESQVLESIDRSYLVGPQSEHNLQQISSQFTDTLRLNSHELNSDMKEQNFLDLNKQGEGQVLTEEPLVSAGNVGSCQSETSSHSTNFGENTLNNGSGGQFSESFISSAQANATMAVKASETALLDERSLLACIVRTIPAGGRIRVNSTLPNRLGKMLAPLHWHDYKKTYGKLDDFVAGHPELFVIEGDYIQLREGAQEMIAATAAAAKVAAAVAAASSPYSSHLPSVAVTPMAQSHRLKKIPSVESKRPNGANFDNTGGISNVKIFSKSKDSHQLNGNFVAKQQSRISGAALTSRR